MKKKNIAASIFLSVCLIVTGLYVGVPNAQALTSSSQDKSYAQSQEVTVAPHSISRTNTHLERANATTLRFRVQADSAEGIATSMSARIVVQRLDAGRWVNVQTINRTQYNTSRIDVLETVNISAHGPGSYRLMVTFSLVVRGITATLNPIPSNTVVM